jgi:hypothetical protein
VAKKASKRRGLVIGHLERVSSGILDKYRREITELVGGRNGIYALYRNNQLYYVGLATNLKARVNQHLRDRHAGRWNYFSLYLVHSEKHLRDLESLAIRIAYPRGNRMRGRFGGAPDLRKMLKRRMSERAMREIHELMGRRSKDLHRVLAARKAVATRKRRRTGKGGAAPLKGLIRNKSLRGSRHGKTYYAWVMSSGRIKLRDGTIHASPSAAARAASGRGVNGWRWWRFKNAKGQWVPVDELRK